MPVRTLSNMPGFRYAIIAILLLAVLVVTVAPEVDLEDGVLRLEFAVYALLLAAISIIALPIAMAASPRFVHALLFSSEPYMSSLPPASQILRC